jgi:hypothetical protein
MLIRIQHINIRHKYLENLVNEIVPDYMKDIVDTFGKQPEFKNPQYFISLSSSAHKQTYIDNLHNLNQMLQFRCRQEYGVACNLEYNPQTHNVHGTIPSTLSLKISLYD